MDRVLDIVILEGKRESFGKNTLQAELIRNRINELRSGKASSLLLLEAARQRVKVEEIEQDSFNKYTIRLIESVVGTINKDKKSKEG